MTIEFLSLDRVSPAALFGHILERDGLQAVVAVVKVDDCWYCTWAGDLNSGDLSFASVKLLHDVQEHCMKGEPLAWSQPCKEPA